VKRNVKGRTSRGRLIEGAADRFAVEPSSLTSLIDQLINRSETRGQFIRTLARSVPVAPDVR
jgi:hypothetical protein